MSSVRVSPADHVPANLHSFNYYHAIIFQNLRQNFLSYFLPETSLAQNSGHAL